MIKYNNYYELLGVPTDSSTKVIKDVYYKKRISLLQKIESSTNPEEVKLIRKDLSKLNFAFQVLTSEARRKQYDEYSQKFTTLNHEQELEVFPKLISEWNKHGQPSTLRKTDTPKKSVFESIKEFDSPIYDSHVKPEEDLLKDMDFLNMQGNSSKNSNNQTYVVSEAGQKIMDFVSSFDEIYAAPVEKTTQMDDEKEESQQLKSDEKLSEISSSRVGNVVKKQVLKASQEARTSCLELNNNLDDIFAKREEVVANIKKLLNKIVNSNLVRNIKFEDNETLKEYLYRQRKILRVLALATSLTALLAYCSKQDDILDMFEEQKNVQPTTSTYTEIEDKEVESNKIVIPENNVLVQDGVVLLKRYYNIAPGDSLSKLSKNSNSTIEEIKRINNLVSDDIKIGDRLIIPYYVLEEDLDLYSSMSYYTGEMSLEDFAKMNNTDVETLMLINGDAIEEVDGKYISHTDRLNVVDFLDKETYRERKAHKMVIAYQNK